MNKSDNKRMTLIRTAYTIYYRSGDVIIRQSKDRKYNLEQEEDRGEHSNFDQRSDSVRLTVLIVCFKSLSPKPPYVKS